LVALSLLIGCGGTSSDKSSKDYNSEINSNNRFNQITEQIIKDDDTSVLFNYTFDQCTLVSEKAKVIDYSSYSLNAQSIGSLKESDGKVNSGARFTQNSYIKVPTVENNFANGLSISAWVDFDHTDNSDQHFVEISNGRDADGKGKDFISFWQGGSSKRLRFKLLNGECNSQIWTNAIKSGLHHYAVSYNQKSGIAKIYRDGKEQRTYDRRGKRTNKMNRDCLDTNVYTRTQNLIGGTHWIEYDKGFAGILDEVKLFDKPLSSNDIKKIYENENSNKHFDGSQRQVLSCNIPTDSVITPDPTPSPKPEPEPEIKPDPVPTFTGKFAKVKTLIDNAQKGKIKNATYICVGDSTRAESPKYNGQYLYYELRDTLSNYNVKSKLFARAGHEARQFANASATPTWQQVASSIEGDGSTTIVDISLGINDVWNQAGSMLEGNLRYAINSIKSQKPNTIFMLTMPNRQYGNDYNTNQWKSVYLKLSREMNIPLNNIVDSLMKTDSSTSYSWYNNDGLNVHLSLSGQHLIANFILQNILP
jgi:hypothetical protein